MKSVDVACLVVAFLVVLLVACASGSVSAPPTQAPNSEDSLVAADHVLTPMPTETMTKVERSVTPTPAISTTVNPMPTVTLSSTITVTSEPEPTAIPTLTVEEATDRVDELIEDGEVCPLPCWWGAIPGETRWSQVESLFYHLGANIYRHYVEIPLVNQDFPMVLDHYVTPQDVISRIEIYLPDGVGYSLAETLSGYGPPSEVWISTYPAVLEGSLPFQTLLLYGAQHFAVSFSQEADMLDGMVVGCPQLVTASGLYLWAPDHLSSFEDIREIFGIGELQLYLPLAEATGQDTSAFYEQFQDSENSDCLETTASLWLGQ